MTFWKLYACAALFIIWLVVGAQWLDPEPAPKLVDTPCVAVGNAS